MDAASRKVSNILDDYRAASNLVTELEYWKARCKAAEKFIDETPCDPDIHDDQIAAHREWQSARDGETDKARYLETLKTGTDGQ